MPLQPALAAAKGSGVRGRTQAISRTVVGFKLYMLLRGLVIRRRVRICGWLPPVAFLGRVFELQGRLSMGTIDKVRDLFGRA